MSDEQTPQPEQQTPTTLSRQGLVSFYAEHGESRHEINEIRFQLLALQEAHERLKAETQRLQAATRQFTAKHSGAGCQAEESAVDAEPTPIAGPAQRRKGAG